MKKPVKAAGSWVFLLTLFWGSGLEAVPQDNEELQRGVSRFLIEKNHQAGRDDVGVTAITLDSRLRLEQCASPLENFLPPGGRILGRVTVGVRCSTPSPWTLYVQARVEWFSSVVVSTRPLLRGAVVGSDDIVVERRDVAEMSSGFFASAADVVGMVATRSLGTAMPLAPGHLKPPTLIRRGERVTIMAVAGALEVRMEGEALQDGAKGEMIRVRNLSSRQEIMGEVVSVGVVQVRMQ